MSRLAPTSFPALFAVACLLACSEVVHEVGTLAGAMPSPGDAGEDATDGSAGADAGQDAGYDAAVPDAAPDGGRPDGGSKQENPFDPACRGRTLPAEPRRLDIYIMMDATLAIEFPVVMRSAKPGLDAFLDEPGSSGIATGIRYFGASCDPLDYAVPDVPIAELPGNAEAVKSFVPSNILSPFPVVQALRGAIRHARERQADTDLGNTKQVVFLVTSEVLPGCGDTPGDLESAAQEGFTGSPPIVTYVFGVNAFNLIAPADLASFLDRLRQVALRGGTAQAYLADLGAQDEELAARMNEARDSAMLSPCDLDYPAWLDKGLPGDPELATLVYTLPGEEPVRVPRVPDASECDPLLEGWYYDDPIRPSRVTACGRTCEILTSDPSPEVNIIAGCAPPPR